MVHYSDFEVDSRIQRQARALAERGDTVECVCLSDDAAFPVGAGEIALHRAARGKPRGGARAYVEGNLRFLARRRPQAHRARSPRALRPDRDPQHARRPGLRGDAAEAAPDADRPQLPRHLPGALRDPLRPPARPPAGAPGAGRGAGQRGFVDCHVFVTEEARDLLRGRGIEAPRTQIVMNTPDERVFGERRPVRTPPSEGPLRVMYHGGLAERFGAETLVRAVAGLRAAAGRSSWTSTAPTPRPPRSWPRSPPRRPRGHPDRPAADPGRADPGPPRSRPHRRRPHPARRLHRAAAAGEAARVRAHGHARDRLGAADDRALLRRRRPLRRARRPGLDRRRDRSGPRRPRGGDRARASRASGRLEQIEWARQRRGYLEMVDGLVAARRS